MLAVRLTAEPKGLSYLGTNNFSVKDLFGGLRLFRLLVKWEWMNEFLILISIFDSWPYLEFIPLVHEAKKVWLPSYKIIWVFHIVGPEFPG